jgi:hypothetical protein
LAPNPVFSTLEHFRDEYLELLIEDERFVPAGVGPVAASPNPSATDQAGVR